MRATATLGRERASRTSVGRESARAAVLSTAVAQLLTAVSANERDSTQFSALRLAAEATEVLDEAEGDLVEEPPEMAALAPRRRRVRADRLLAG